MFSVNSARSLFANFYSVTTTLKVSPVLMLFK